MSKAKSGVDQVGFLTLQFASGIERAESGRRPASNTIILAQVAVGERINLCAVCGLKVLLTD
jgi:hypothetical protein